MVAARLIWVVLAGLLTSNISAARSTVPHACANSAKLQAADLVRYHLGFFTNATLSEQVTVDPDVKVLAPLVNPADRSRKLFVLELWAYSGKGEFRVRMLYLPSDTRECLPVGRELLVWSPF